MARLSSLSFHLCQIFFLPLSLSVTPTKEGAHFRLMTLSAKPDKTPLFGGGRGNAGRRSTKVIPGYVHLERKERRWRKEHLHSSTSELQRATINLISCQFLNCLKIHARTYFCQPKKTSKKLTDLGGCLCRRRSWSEKEGGSSGSAPFSKMGSSTLSRSKEGGEAGKFASPSLLPSPFGAHGGNFSRATITLVADKSNVLINAHRHASSSSSFAHELELNPLSDCGKVNICVT